MLYRPVYVHAKVGIVDDRWLTVGSANLNNRGFLNDAELNIAVANPQAASELRVSLWAEHLQASLDDVVMLQAVERGLESLQRQAQENFDSCVTARTTARSSLTIYHVRQGQRVRCCGES